MDFVVGSGEPYAEISAVIIRADGTSKDLGVVSKQPLTQKVARIIKNRIKQLWQP